MEINILKISKIYWLLSEIVVYYIQTDKLMCKANLNIVLISRLARKANWKEVKNIGNLHSGAGRREAHGQPSDDQRMAPERNASRPQGWPLLANYRRGYQGDVHKDSAESLLKGRLKQWQYVANAIGRLARVQFASLVCKRASENHSAGRQAFIRIVWLFAC